MFFRAFFLLALIAFFAFDRQFFVDANGDEGNDGQSQMDAIISGIFERKHLSQIQKEKIGKMKAELLKKYTRNFAEGSVEKTIGDALRNGPEGREEFEANVRNQKPCREPILLSKYTISKYTGILDMIGVYHAGILVCGIEIHFHRTGVEYRLPLESFNESFNGKFVDYFAIPEKGTGMPIHTGKSFLQIVEIVEKMAQTEFSANEYKFFTHNCLLFARKLVQRLVRDGVKIDWKPWPLHLIKVVDKFFGKK